jgi:predicted ribosomally synthesized peptide with SipW-like signal peptide
MFKKKLVTLLSTFLVGLMLIASGTNAIFTSHDENDNPFTSGTVIVSLDKDSTQGEYYFEVTNMAPGDTEERMITVTNTGTLELRFDLNHEFDTNAGMLGDKLAVSYYKFDGVDGNGDDIWTPITNPTNANLVLAAGASIPIKVDVHLPLDTDDVYQDTTALLNLRLSAEQTKNNEIGSVNGQVNFMNAVQTFELQDYYAPHLPFNTYYHDQRYQYIILKEEIEALGFSPGDSIEKISFKAGMQAPNSTIGLNNFTIRMKNTSINSLLFWEEGLTTVYNDFVSTSNWATDSWHEFSLSSFVWSGDNLIVDITRDNTSWSGYGGMWVTEVSGPNNRVLGFYSDSWDGSYPFAGVHFFPSNYIIHTKLFGSN